MKRENKIITLLLTLALTLMPQYLSATLKVYRLSGNVMLKKGNKQTNLQRRETLQATDILTIPAGGRVEILDSDTRRIYTLSSVGSNSVKSLIAKAASEAEAITRQTHKRMLDAVKENAETRKKGYHIQGLSIHETDGIMHAPMELPDGMSYLAYLLSIDDNSRYDDSNDIILMRRNYLGDDSTFNFAVFNTLEIPLYFNIIDQRSGEYPIMYFKENPVATPCKETVISEYRYLLPEDLSGYVVIASDKNFTQEDVHKLLDPAFNPEQDFYFSLFRL